MKYTGVEGEEEGHHRAEVEKWERLENWEGRITLWTSFEHIEEYSIFLAIMNKVKDPARLEIIDVSRLFAFCNPGGIGSCRPSDLATAINHSFYPSEDCIQEAKDRFAYFDADKPNEIRVLGKTAPQFVLMSYFDEAILNRMGQDWKQARNTGPWLDHKRYRMEAGLSVPFFLWRLDMLVRDGIVERRLVQEAEPDEMGRALSTEVRLAPFTLFKQRFLRNNPFG